MLPIRWLKSKIVRQALDLCRQARRILKAQRDQLSPQAIAAVSGAITELRAGVNDAAKPEAINELMDKLEKAAAKWFKPYPSAAARENVEMFLTTTAVLLAVFTFFIQHFAIPTGSMQPTLYGVHHENHAGDPTFQIPGVLGRAFDRCVRGISYYQLAASADGFVRGIERPTQLVPFVKRQRLMFNDNWVTVWFPPPNLAQRAGLLPEWRDFGSNETVINLNIPFKKGEDILKLKITAGDHLFVDRMTYNFRHPTRGEIIVFTSAGIPGLIENTFYIKRLIAVAGEKLRIGNDRHVIINGQRLDASTPHFENVYGFDPRNPPRTDVYSGHVNQKVANANQGNETLSPLFPDENTEITIGQGRAFAMGDNTMNSHDCRNWGYDADAMAFGFPQKKIIGRASLVFWPISPRFGWVHF